MAGTLQEGIFWDAGQRPGAHFKILFLRVTHGQRAADVHKHLAALWEIWEGLKQGRVRELGDVTVPPRGLTVLLAFGSNLFKLDGVEFEEPVILGDKNRFLSPRGDGGGKLLPGGGLRYAADVRQNPATEELAVQFIADSPLAVHRAQVETWRYLEGQADPDTLLPPMQISSFFDGFHREDRRSWIGFHDGISNLRKGRERLSVIQIRPDDAGFEDWIVGGTTMVFLNLPVDLRAWDAIPTEQQELLVGRAKGSGCPLKAAEDGVGVPVGGCPASGATIVSADGSIEPAFREIPDNVDEIIRVSHVQRANHNQNTPDKIDSRRIYRQGYEFLSPTQDNSGLRVGLNFVSFQDDPARCIFMLSSVGWLGNVSFGGADDAQTAAMQGLIQVRAAAVFLVPPFVDGEPFPGARVLQALPGA